MDRGTPLARLSLRSPSCHPPTPKHAFVLNLVELIESQLNTMEKETFGCITKAELWKYEDRRDRICQLYAELIDREAAA